MMSNVYSLPSQDSTDEHAGLWISRINRGLSRAEEQAFEAWISEDPQHYEALMSLSLLWDDMEDLSRLADLFPEESLADVSHRRFVLPALSTAAALFFTFVVFLPPFFQATSLEQSYETSIGEHSTVSLPDGSELVLNTDSLVKVAYDDDHRLLTLERGEIHVDVAHDEERPLSVKAGNRVVQAVGTAFNVELLDSESLELIVVDGKVRVGSRDVFEATMVNAAQSQNGNTKKQRLVARLPKESLSISKGEKVLLSMEQKELHKPVFVAQKVISDALSWRQGKLVFNGESLEEVISEIGRYSSIEFQFESEDIKSVRIAGTFKSGDIRGLLTALDDTFNVSSKKIAKNRFSLHR